MTSVKDSIKKKLKESITAEIFVAHYYQKLKYKILHHQYRCTGSEIDLICLRKKHLLFVEVKLRKYWPLDSSQLQQLIPFSKKKCLEKGIVHYLTKYHDIKYETISCDLVLVKKNSRDIGFGFKKFIGLKRYENIDLFQEM